MPKRNEPRDVWKYVAIGEPDACWEWTGYRFKKGYGRFAIGRKMYAAHRVVYALAHPGTISLSAPTDSGTPEFVLHRCDNRFCCNPDHLFLGSKKDNIQDCITKGRRADLSGAKNPCAKLSDARALAIREQFAAGLTRAESARIHGVSWTSVQKVVTGARYA